MINTIRILNFKSVVDLSLNLGVFNVIIGENGSGKSNILEAIAFGAAASARKLDYEFLGSRGIRVTNPEFMFSAFAGKKEQVTSISYGQSEGLFSNQEYHIAVDPESPRKWINAVRPIIRDSPNGNFVLRLFQEEDEAKRREIIIDAIGQDTGSILYIEEIVRAISTLSKAKTMDDENLFNVAGGLIANRLSDETISNFIIYSPEQSSLRKFEETAQIYPLGIRGEGLFQYLKELSFDEKKKEKLHEIKENLLLLDWYENFKMPENLVSNEFALNIKDKYLDGSLEYFDQRSTNEGFLYLLFYSTLFVSDLTPSFFAIDNIDTSFNPKLCMRLIKNLVSLAKKHNKQVIVTTQNPAILDGLDLSDNDQRLFVVRRNDEGHTKATRIDYKPERKVKLSEAWTGGYIGGLPDNF